MPSLFWVSIGVVAALAMPAWARADGGAPRRRPGPCADCVASLPDGSDPRPLLVLLHGDGETASSMFEAWQASAAARRVAVLALACPAAEGCGSRSWWRWNGEPEWLVRQVSAFAELRAIDRERMWIVGWSGGASYIGFRTQEIERSFAAIVLHGGGVPPARGICPTTSAPIYFLVGDANPLHSLAVRLRDHYETCKNDLTWMLLKGADHEGERRALPAHREAILDWLATKRLSSPASSASSASLEGGTAAEGGTDDAGDASAASRAPLPKSMPVGSRASCRCECPPEAGIGPWRDRAVEGLVLLGAMLGAAVRRAVRGQGAPRGCTPSTR
jgi:predicted esterase